MAKKKLKDQNSITVKSDIDIDAALGNAHRKEYLEDNPHGYKKVKHVHKNKKKYNRKKKHSSRDYNWSIRLSARTPGFHPGKRGSIPLWTTKSLLT